MTSCLGPEWCHAQVNGLDRWAAVSGGAYVQAIQQLQTGYGEPPRYAAFVNHNRVTDPEIDYDEGWVVPAHDVFDTPEQAAAATWQATENRFIWDQPGGWDCPPSPPGHDDPTTEPAHSLIAAALAESYWTLMQPLQAPPAPMVSPALIGRLLQTLAPEKAVETAIMNLVDHMRRAVRWEVSNYPELRSRAPDEFDDPWEGDLDWTGNLTPDERLARQLDALLDEVRNPKPRVPADHPARVARLAYGSPYRDARKAVDVLHHAMIRAEAAGFDAAAVARLFARQHFGAEVARELMPLLDELGVGADFVASLQDPPKALTPVKPLTRMEWHAFDTSLAAWLADPARFGDITAALDALKAAHAADGYTGRSPAFTAGLRALEDVIQRQADAGGFGKENAMVYAQTVVDVWCRANDFPPITIKVVYQAPA